MTFGIEIERVASQSWRSGFHLQVPSRLFCLIFHHKSKHNGLLQSGSTNYCHQHGRGTPTFSSNLDEAGHWTHLCVLMSVLVRNAEVCLFFFHCQFTPLYAHARKDKHKTSPFELPALIRPEISHQSVRFRRGLSQASLAPAFDSALADTAGSDGYPELPMGKQSRFAPTVGATSSAPAARRRTRRRAGKKPLQHFSELVEMETMRDDSADERDDGSGDDSEIKLNVQGPLATQQQTLLTSTNSAMDEDHNDDDEDGDDDDDFGFRRLTSASRKPIKRSGSVTAAAVADAVFASTKSSRRQSRSVAGDLRHTNSGAAADAAAEDAGGAETLENSSRDHSTRAPAAPKNASSSTALRRRSSTGEVVNRGYGRRRGSRAAMIEQPDADAGELSRPGRTRSSESSLSYCTVPLPGMADSTESPAFDVGAPLVMPALLSALSVTLRSALSVTLRLAVFIFGMSCTVKPFAEVWNYLRRRLEDACETVFCDRAFCPLAYCLSFTYKAMRCVHFVCISAPTHEHFTDMHGFFRSILKNR